MKRTWKNVELKGDAAEKLWIFLKVNGYTFEPSGCGEYTHFEVLCNNEETLRINNYLDTI